MSSLLSDNESESKESLLDVHSRVVTLLLVEDEAIIAMSQIVHLKREGFDVVHAVDGPEALQICQERSDINLVLMDINLGRGMDGTQVAARILAFRDIPLVFLSSHAEQKIIDRTEAISCFGYVLKTAGIPVLVASINMALRLFETKKHLERERENYVQLNRELLLRTEALRLEEELVKTTLYSIGDGVITTDSEGLITRMNQASTALTGWTEDEARGRPLEEVFCIINEDSRKKVESPVRKVVQTGQIVGLANHTLLIAKDGSERPIADSGAPIYIAGKGLAGVVLVFRDQSEVRKAQQKLEESERHFRSIFELASVGIVQVEAVNGKILQCNQTFCDFIGYTAQELQGTAFSTLTFADDRASNLAAFRDVAENGGLYQVEKRYVRKDNTVVWAKLTTTFLRDAKGKAIKTIAIVEDLTQQKKNEKVIVDAAKEKEVLFQELQHRVKNSLSMISSVVQLEEEGTDNAEAKEALQSIKGRIMVLSHLYQLLGGETGSAIRLDSYLKMICESIQRTYDNTEGRISQTLALESLTLDLKRTTNLGLITNELLTNTYKHAFKKGEHGHIDVKLTANPEGIALVIHDDGAGIKSNGDPNQSDGLGLKIVQELVSQMYGTLTFETVKGSHIRVLIPPSIQKA